MKNKSNFALCLFLMCAFVCACAQTDDNAVASAQTGDSANAAQVKAVPNSDGKNAGLVLASAGIRPKKSAVSISPSRLKFAEKSFKDSLKKRGAAAGGMCVVENGKLVNIAVWNFQEGKSASNAGSKKAPSFTENTPLPIGKSSVALISLAMLADPKIDLDKRVGQYCSFFKFGEGGGQFVTARHLLSMRSGLAKHSDTLVPKNAGEREIFEIAAQIAPAAAPDLVHEDSALGVQLACEAVAYLKNPSSGNLKKTFLSEMKKNLFDRLSMKSVRLFDSKNPIFMSTAFCLTMADTAKWLCYETSPNPPFSDARSLEERRISKVSFDRFSMGWLGSVRGGLKYFVCADDFNSVANVIAVYPDKSCAVAFFALGSKKSACAAACALALENFTSMLSNCQ